MYIEPNTTIRVYTGIPWDNTYTNTLYFWSDTAQKQFFATTDRLKYVFSNNSYQRVERGKMRIERKAEDLYDCNYLAFQNTNYGNKWFYAFITGVEFINNVTSEITFEIDVIQTYLFDSSIVFKDCFVEREHSVTDEIGDNIQPENVDLGEYVESDYGTVDNSLINNYIVLMMVAAKSVNVTNWDVFDFDNAPAGVLLYAFRLNDTGGIHTILNANKQSPDNIVSMYIAPLIVFGRIQPELGGELLTGNPDYAVADISLPALQGTESFGGITVGDTYVPKNKKLYTYPYNFCNVSNGSNGSLTLRYEFFHKNSQGKRQPWLKAYANILAPVRLVVRPNEYKGMTNNNVSKTEYLTIDSYPYCCWNYDYYTTWVSQNALTNTLSNVTTIGLGVGASAVTGNPVPAISSIVASVTNVLSNHYQASIHADVVKGNAATGNTDYANGFTKIFYSRFHITSEYAKVIDDFFSEFGYACNRVKTPNFASRPHWNYIKTKGCNIKGYAPADEIKRICTIFDNGITFWKNVTEVGDYSLDNSPQ